MNGILKALTYKRAWALHLSCMIIGFVMLIIQPILNHNNITSFTLIQLIGIPIFFSSVPAFMIVLKRAKELDDKDVEASG